MIIIKHIACFRLIIINRQNKPATIHFKVGTSIESLLHFPFQIRIDISQFRSGLTFLSVSKVTIGKLPTGATPFGLARFIVV